MRDKPKGIDIDLIQIGSDFIKEIGTADGRLFVRGGSGAFYSCLAETDEKGRIIEEIYSGEMT